MSKAWPTLVAREHFGKASAFSSADKRALAVCRELSMPEWTGTEMARELQDVRRGVPINLLTGFGANLSEGHLREAGLIESQEKPGSVADLALVMHREQLKQPSVEGPQL